MKKKLSIVAFSNLAYPLDQPLVDYCKEQGIKLSEIKLKDGEDTDQHKILKLLSLLNENRIGEKGILLVLNAGGTYLTGSAEDILEKYDEIGSQVLFAADANFTYPEGPLQYYYWKFYPRWNKYYNYLDSSTFAGEVSAIREMLRDILLAYKLDAKDKKTTDPYFTRYYLDVCLDIFKPSYSLAIDGDQKLLAATAGSLGAAKWPYVNWVVDHFQYLEDQKWKDRYTSFLPIKVRGIKIRKGKIINTRTKQSPQVLAIPQSYYNLVIPGKPSTILSFVLGTMSYKLAFWRFLLVFIVNRFSIDRHQTFRFEKHKNPDYENTMQKFLGFLETGRAFTFAHFNDGELNFIRKYLKNDHKKTWNGRIQDQYDIPLAERLLDSIKYQQDNYFIGVSCSTCGAPRRKIADELMGEYRGKVGAMVFHHNLRYLPKIISQMVNREMYFVVNEHQNLGFLENLGVTVKEENKILIPFVNSHKEYDNLKDRKFPEGAFVILMCGMLAKVLIRNWYELSPQTTFIALGSTMDDFIQLSNTNYRPYPKKLPLTRNIHLIKSFLFGKKKRCVEFFNI